jgi:hypothetical protein
VLSESSLFVYPTKWVLKTCGTTKLLRAVPRLLAMAAELSMQPRRCKYSRASFLFPEQQVRLRWLRMARLQHMHGDCLVMNSQICAAICTAAVAGSC